GARIDVSPERAGRALSGRRPALSATVSAVLGGQPDRAHAGAAGALLRHPGAGVQDPSVALGMASEGARVPLVWRGEVSRRRPDTEPESGACAADAGAAGRDRARLEPHSHPQVILRLRLQLAHPPR